VGFEVYGKEEKAFKLLLGLVRISLRCFGQGGRGHEILKGPPFPCTLRLIALRVCLQP
jgi:hypothetical protein